jgi:hypothetical protein
MTTTTKTERTEIIYRVVTLGCVSIFKEADGTYTVEHADLYRVYSSTPGFKTYKAAKREWKVGA